MSGVPGKLETRLRMDAADTLRTRLEALRDSRGVTGLETAIVLIAFVVVASVFAFAVISVGLFSRDSFTDSLRTGIHQAGGVLQVRGSVIAKAGITGDRGAVDEIMFMVAIVVGNEPVDITPGETIIQYTDDHQLLLFDTGDEFEVIALGNADSDTLVERGEIYQIVLKNLVDGLSPRLSTSDRFQLQVLRPQGAVLFVDRTTPPNLDVFNILE